VSGEMEPLPSALAAPLLDGEQLLGVLAVYDTTERPYTPGDAGSLAVIAGQLAAAVRQRPAKARLLFGSFERELRRAQRLGATLSVIELEVNQLERIRDRFGRQAADRILRSVARAIRSQLRPNDTCVRSAGSEFIITVPGVGAAGIAGVQARIEMAIGRHKFAVARGQFIRVGVSLGAASFPEDGAAYDALIAVAEARMGRRKPPGRADSQVN